MGHPPALCTTSPVLDRGFAKTPNLRTYLEAVLHVAQARDLIVRRSKGSAPLDRQMARMQAHDLVPLPILSGKSLTGNFFLPTYAEFGGWPALVWFFARSLTLVAVFGWLAPRLSAVARRFSLTLFVGTFYLCSFVLFPCYVPPWTLLASLVLAFPVDTLYRHPAVGARPAAASTIRIGCVLAIFVHGAILACVAW